ncbi:hypothetical protein [Amycolatopsis sp. NPDC021455]|uniref:hypothetical protein n=1 Tax=Amycolatopsis sp. NPDC021455 TaxID=3154901 RepID=UPI0033FE2863
MKNPVSGGTGRTRPLTRVRDAADEPVRSTAGRGARVVADPFLEEPAELFTLPPSHSAGVTRRKVFDARDERPNVAFGASNAPNVAFGALDATNATLGRSIG